MNPPGPPDRLEIAGIVLRTVKVTWFRNVFEDVFKKRLHASLDPPDIHHLAVARDFQPGFAEFILGLVIAEDDTVGVKVPLGADLDAANGPVVKPPDELPHLFSKLTVAVLGKRLAGILFRES